MVFLVEDCSRRFLLGDTGGRVIGFVNEPKHRVYPLRDGTNKTRWKVCNMKQVASGSELVIQEGLKATLFNDRTTKNHSDSGKRGMREGILEK